MEGSDGRMALKLDALPTNPDWSGWIAFYEPTQQDGYQQRQSSPPRQERAPTTYQGPVGGSLDEEEDDIPF